MMHLIGIALAVFAGLSLWSWNTERRRRKAVAKALYHLNPGRLVPRPPNPNPPGVYNPQVRWAP